MMVAACEWRGMVLVLALGGECEGVDGLLDWLGQFEGVLFGGHEGLLAWGHSSAQDLMLLLLHGSLMAAIPCLHLFLFNLGW